ncbi:MAG: SUMF1/EgtB/PvdO family nonheme iron enzyme [Bacteroidales bacterium]|nr:SUMF1/EgtB/PvdO family nonheme iron enzyme [Bacteroidales bacterium]
MKKRLLICILMFGATTELLAQNTVNPILREFTSGIESRDCFYHTVWVCTGDTIEIDSTDKYNIKYVIDGFWITCTEITQNYWEWYMHSLPDALTNLAMVGDSLPITCVSRAEVDAFCHQINISVKQEWRLPTREEWLFAYSGGLFSEGYTYSGSNHPDYVAWTRRNGSKIPKSGGLLIANELGIYDMTGNVAEMVVSDGKTIVLGGNIDDEPKTLDENIKDYAEHSLPNPLVGFRLVFHQPIRINKYNERFFD